MYCGSLNIKHVYTKVVPNEVSKSRPKWLYIKTEKVNAEHVDIKMI